MADEVEVPLISVAALADARHVCQRAAVELAAIADGAEVIDALASGFADAATGVDEFMAELHNERLGEFPADRWPKGEPYNAELVETPTSSDEPRNDVPPAAEPEDAPTDPSDEEGPQDVPDHDALYAEAQRLDIRGRTKMSDAELADAIAEAG